jgi:hypothetical protein
MITLVQPILDLDRRHDPCWRFAAGLAKHPAGAYSGNISVRTFGAINNGFFHPVVVPTAGNSSHLCSTSRFYFDAAADEFAGTDAWVLQNLC